MRTLDEDWFQRVDRFGKVGSRHHVIPRFVLQKWADPRGLVWVKSKHDRREGVRNVRDIGITDFYTFLATDGHLDSTVEEMLSVVEDRGAAVLKVLNNPYRPDVELAHDDHIHLAEFVAVQITRSPRMRRELELMADWYGKTMAAGVGRGRVSDEDLRTFEFVPHQNEHVELVFPMADSIADELLKRPVSLVAIDRPLFLIGDEMVILNTAGDPVHHQPDCEMTDAEFEKKLKKAARKRGRKRREVKRLLHIYTAQPRDIVSAIEIAMPISPRTVVLFGPQTEWEGGVDRGMVTGRAADVLAERVNERIVHCALDSIVGRVEDPSFRQMPVPERAALLAVCGSHGAARDALMAVPERLRPRRLKRDA